MSKIIWVDDDINRPELRAEKEELQERGCEIIAVQDTDEFLELLKKPQENFNYDGVILDLSMPVGYEFTLKEAAYGSRTGLLLLKKIRENILFQNIKVIVYSIVDNDNVDRECKRANALYLKKANLLADDFAERVMDWINPQKNH